MLKITILEQDAYKMEEELSSKVSHYQTTILAVTERSDGSSQPARMKA